MERVNQGFHLLDARHEHHRADINPTVVGFGRNIAETFVFKNFLIEFQLKICIILLKVAIPLDVVSIYKSCGRMRDGKRSCLIIVDNRQKNLPDLIF